jgi:hypothetical protein
MGWYHHEGHYTNRELFLPTVLTYNKLPALCDCEETIHFKMFLVDAACSRFAACAPTQQLSVLFSSGELRSVWDGG